MREFSSRAASRTHTTEPVLSRKTARHLKEEAGTGGDYPRPPVNRDEIERQEYPPARRGTTPRRCRGTCAVSRTVRGARRATALRVGRRGRVGTGPCDRRGGQGRAQELRDAAGREAERPRRARGRGWAGAAGSSSSCRQSWIVSSAACGTITAEALAASLERAAQRSGHVRVSSRPSAPPPRAQSARPEPGTRQRRALGRRGRRSPRRAQHGARRACRARRPRLPRRALRARRCERVLDAVYSSAGR